MGPGASSRQPWTATRSTATSHCRHPAERNDAAYDGHDKIWELEAKLASASGANPGSSIAEANGAAWLEGKRLLERAIAERGNVAFETTLGGSTLTKLLTNAIDAGIDVHIWYVALESPELHLTRVRERVLRGGHDIPERDVRRRYDASRQNLIELLHGLASLRVHDNSADADPAPGVAPAPKLLLHQLAGITSFKNIPYMSLFQGLGDSDSLALINQA